MPIQYLIVITILGWGIGSIFYKLANDSLHPIMVSTIITGVYIVITPLPFFFLNFDKSINSNGLLYSIVGGLLMCAGSMGYFFALKQGAAGEISTVTALYPALTLILSCFFMGETMNLKKGIGICLALLSVYILGSK